MVGMENKGDFVQEITCDQDLKKMSRVSTGALQAERATQAEAWRYENVHVLTSVSTWK